MADCGVELDEFDRVASSLAAPAVRPTIAASDDHLRRLERMLRPSVRSDFSHDAPTLQTPAPTADAPPLAVDMFDAPEGFHARRRTSSRGVKELLVLGAVAFAAGVALLISSNFWMREAAWRWGMATTIAGEGLLIGGLVALAARLWRNSRRINAQLDVIDRRLGDVQASVGNASGAAMFSGDSLWRVDAGEPLGRFERSAVAVR